MFGFNKHVPVAQLIWIVRKVKHVTHRVQLSCPFFLPLSIASCLVITPLCVLILNNMPFENVRLAHLVDFTYHVFTHMPGDSYHRWFRSLVLCPLLDVWDLSRAVSSLLLTLDLKNLFHSRGRKCLRPVSVMRCAYTCCDSVPGFWTTHGKMKWSRTWGRCQAWSATCATWRWTCPRRLTHRTDRWTASTRR